MVIINEKYYAFILFNEISFSGKVFNPRSKYNWFFKNHKQHRYYGPSTIGKNKIWYFNGKYYGSLDNRNYSQKQFLKELNKQWLY